MGISRLSRRTWLAVPMAAATIGLAAPAAANAAPAPARVVVATTTTAATTTTPGTSTTPAAAAAGDPAGIPTHQTLAARDATEPTLTPARRGTNRWKKL